MSNQDLIDYIKRELKKGVDLNKIKEKLLLVGHHEFHVNDAIEKVNKKRKKLNYAILFISLTVFLTVIILSYNLFISQFERDIDVSGPSTDLQTFSRAIREDNLNLCNDIEDENLKQNCLNYQPSEPSTDLQIFSRAIRENDLTKCRYIMDSGIRENCLNYQPSEPSPDLRSFSKAIRENNPLLCNEILSEDIKNNCRNYFR